VAPPNYNSFLPEDYYVTGDYTPVQQTSQTLASTIKFAASLALINKIGSTQFGEKRGYDYLIGGIRAVEEFSPGRVLRTFQLSHMLSPLETASRQSRYFSPDLLSRFIHPKLGTPAQRGWLSYISELTGENILSGDVLSEGFRFEGGKLRVGRKGGRVLLEHASIIRNIAGAEPRFQTAYARSLVGGPYRSARALFLENIPYETQTGKIESELFSFTGGKTKRQAFGRYISGYGTSLIERLNQLARAPAELPGVSKIFSKLPSFGVVPSSGLKTLGKLSAKLGIAVPAAILAYQQLDYYTRQSSFFDETIFKEGITAGIANIWANTQIGISKAADILGLHSYREKQEEIAPGSTSLQKLLAFPIIGGLTGIGINYAYRVYSQINMMSRGGMNASIASSAYAASQELYLKTIGARGFQEDIISALPASLDRFATQEASEMSEGYLGRLARKMVSSSEYDTLTGKIIRGLGLAERPTFGRILGLGGLTLGALAVAPFIPGALVSSDRPEKLEDIYSGKEEIPIRKGRGWEFGKSPYEGSRINRYEPHPVVRLQNRWKDVSIYGEKELSPLEKWYKQTFSYDIERENYYDRPYPQTTPAFQEVPLIGPLLGATIGRFIKPPVLMHTSEWMRQGPGPGAESSRMDIAENNMSYLAMPLRYGERRPIPQMGEFGEGAPVFPFGLLQTIGEQQFNLSEATGLPGFTMGSIKEAITGRQDFFDEQRQLASAGDIYSSRRSFWDEELGGLAGLSEIWRRLYPHSKRKTFYNPIPNQMPDWLPGAGDKSENFRVGDPMGLIPHGEWRLPGAGYQSRFPELKGLDPNDYPNIHKLRILSDVAMYSDKYREMERIVRAERKRGELSDEEEEMYQQIREQMKAKKVRREFTPYKYREREYNNPAELALAQANEEAKNKEGPSFFERVFGKYWEFLGHNVETPLENLTPVSPGAKLVHMRTAVEDYERMQVYGSERGFWQHPVRDFLKPFFYSSLHAMGWEGIPGEIEQKRETEEYFDILKYIKYTKLRQQAVESGDKELVGEFEDKRRETLFGINPYGHIYTHIFRALPRNDRNYFNEFVKADAEEREEIIKMIPENEKALFQARWEMEDAINWRKALKKGILTGEQEEKAKKEIRKMYDKKKTEGFPIDDELFERYIKTRMEGESYADWYRRTILLPKELAGRVLPGPDWCGWNPAISLEDIKLKVVQETGGDPFMYDIWPDQIRTAARRPYLEEATEQLEGNMTPDEVKKRIEDIFNSNNISIKSISLKPLYGSNSNEASLLIKEDRSTDIRSIIKDNEDAF